MVQIAFSSEAIPLPARCLLWEGTFQTLTPDSGSLFALWVKQSKANRTFDVFTAAH